MIYALIHFCSSLAQFKSSYPASVTNHIYWNDYRICHPPFNWSLPKGLTPQYLKLFFEQPENMRHFLDTNSTDHCGVVKSIEKGLILLPFSKLSNVTHFINSKGIPLQAKFPRTSLLLVLTGHWGHYFQHFFDNIGPQLSLAMDAMGLQPKDVSIVIDESYLFPNVPLLWKRIGFKKIIYARYDKFYDAKNLVYVESAPKVHPYYFSHLRKLLKIPNNPPKKIIYISRKLTNSYYNQRFILNEPKLIEMLQSICGHRNLIVFDHHNYTLDETIELFSTAKAIIGAHGGGLYNQFFAPKTAVIIEIMPIKPNGLYPDQKSKYDTPSFSHMAVWSNSLLIGQPFYRFYQITYLSNFFINLTEFDIFLSGVTELYEDEL